jgi:predicted ATP-grasp superfamily ATP-dependent carboligase
MAEPLLILGASARAAAFSALAAGLKPWCGDLFADADLARVATVERVEGYPAGLQRAAERAPHGPWLYTGSLENHPRLVERLAARRPLAGNGATALRAVRDPGRWGGELARHDLPCPAWSPAAAGVPIDGSWLRKPRSGGGGQRIEPWIGQGQGNVRGFYFQRRIEGTACAAVYVGQRGKARLLGVTEQLIGQSWAGGRGFGYCGSVGPIDVSTRTAAALVRLGDVLAAAFGLAGLFGVDGVMASGTFWPVEINPRFSASVEVLERTLGFSAVGLHIAACGGDSINRWPIAPLPAAASERAWSGKAILYAGRNMTAGKRFAELLDEAAATFPRPSVADVPSVGSEVRAGWPVLTILADGPDRGAVMEALRTRAAGMALA